MQNDKTILMKNNLGASRILRIIPGYLLAAACLLWVFHDIHFKELIGSFTGIHWGWVAGAVVLDILSYVCQGIRWRLLLHPLGNITAFQTTQSIYAGLFVNEILPMRLGEILRIYLASQRISAPISAIIPSILVERSFDAVWLTLAFGITVLTVPLPKYLVDFEEILGFIALGATVFLIYLVFFKKGKKTQNASGTSRLWRPIWRLASFLGAMSEGIRNIGQSGFFYSSFGISSLLLLGQVLSYWFVMMACGLNLSFWHGAAVFLIMHIGTIIPGAPSNVGTYQFFTVFGLTLFGIDKTLAGGFSIVVFLILTIPLWILGMLAFAHLRLNLKKLRTEIASFAGNTRAE
jgi:glycosyltransferase 2 family protein